MLKRTVRTSMLVAAVSAASAFILLSGCDREPIGATTNPSNANSSPTTDNRADNGQAPATPKPKLKPGARTVVLARAGDRPYDKTFDDLRFEMTVGEPFYREMLPDNIEAMKDQRIRIRGFILPTPQKRGIKTFVLVRDNQECCFGPGAALYDCILVKMQPGKTAEFSIRPVTVEGTFDIREVRGPDGVHLAIYHLAAESVE
ncbi:MAG: DUF3299 domain-containing protein [Planctomycetes bacterium]|nr:DUF3299 domain-containing protein [Planctomycetota bacterium]